MNVIYARISRDREGAGIGVARQEKECRELLADVDLVITDNDLSAYSGKPRPGYERLLGLLNDGRVQTLVVWHNDRLHRSPKELEAFIDVIERNPVTIRTVTAGLFDLSTPAGRMQARVLGAAARYESEQKSVRIKSKFREKAAAGEWHGGVRPFGYDDDGVTIRESEAETVRQATREVLAGGSLRDIARRLNDAGVTSTLGKPWSPNQVKAMLIRARNAGLREHHGEVVGQATWPALVEEADWRAARALLMDPSRRTTTTNARKYLLSGIATCAECDGVIIAKWVTTRRSKRLVYECRYSHCVARAMHHVDALVEETVIARLQRDDARDLLQVEPNQGVDLNAEADELRARMQQAAEAFTVGAITMQQLQTITQGCQNRLSAINATQLDGARASLLYALVDAADAHTVWEGLSLTQRRAVIGTLLDVSLARTARRGPGFDVESVRLTWR